MALSTNRTDGSGESPDLVAAVLAATGNHTRLTVQIVGWHHAREQRSFELAGRLADSLAERGRYREACSVLEPAIRSMRRANAVYRRAMEADVAAHIAARRSTPPCLVNVCRPRCLGRVCLLKRRASRPTRRQQRRRGKPGEPPEGRWRQGFLFGGIARRRR